MLKSAVGASVIVGLLVFAYSASRGDTTSSPSDPAPMMPAPGDETGRRDPFTPHDPGPPKGHWHYDKLSAGEKAVVDRGRTRQDAPSVHAAYDVAVTEAEADAKANAASNQLESSDVETIGVVP